MVNQQEHTDDKTLPKDSMSDIESNATLQKALGPLITEFRLLRESVHADYSDLKDTISKQKEEVKHKLSDTIDSNTQRLTTISEENKAL